MLLLLTIVYSSEASISKFFFRIKVIGGFYKFFVRENRDAEVGIPAFNV